MEELESEEDDEFKVDEELDEKEVGMGRKREESPSTAKITMRGFE